MNPTRILPDLQCSLLCEEIRQETNGNFILIGIINILRVPKTPITALKLCLFNRWTAGLGTFHETTRLIAPDQTTIIRQTKAQFTLRDPAIHATNVSLLTKTPFKQTGTYHIEINIEDIMKLRYPLLVTQARPKQPPPNNPNQNNDNDNDNDPPTQPT